MILLRAVNLIACRNKLPAIVCKRSSAGQVSKNAVYMLEKFGTVVDVSSEGAPFRNFIRTSTTGSHVYIEAKKQKYDWIPSPSSDYQVMAQYKKLSKFRLSTLVVITSFCGYAMAPAPFDVGALLLCSIGTGLVSAAANSINQYHEVPFDSQMSRTNNRVLVTGQLTPLHAVGFAIFAASTGLSILYFGVNGITALLAAGNLMLYTNVYTPLKRISIINTWVGSLVGAIPPLIGWVGCVGHFDPGSFIVAGVLYAWQFPHFNALSWNLRADYSRAGYRMMAVTNPKLCRQTSLRYSVITAILSVAAPAFDLTNSWFVLESLPLNIYLIYLAYKFYKKSDSKTSRALFRFSLLHLPILMALFLFNKRRWLFNKENLEHSLEGDLAMANEMPIELVQ